MPPYPDPKPPYERTGAGDACASTITIALALGLPFTTALQWGPINSMSVVQYIGAQEGLLTRAKLEEYLRAKPEYYVAEQLPV
jgi:sugar/nucleoside kinase (ribokinase family)